MGLHIDDIFSSLSHRKRFSKPLFMWYFLSNFTAPNCTLVELKYFFSFYTNVMHFSPNCTLVELKSSYDLSYYWTYGTPNCTLVELKSVPNTQYGSAVSSKLYLSGIEMIIYNYFYKDPVSPNCTLVELKFHIETDGWSVLGLQIVP